MMTSLQASAREPEARRPSKRERLVAAARDEIHQRGFAATTIAKIAETADVPLGNVYYYFKTKEDLVRAVVDEHTNHVKGLLEDAASAPSPGARLVRFIDLLKGSCEEVAENGCPIGCLNQDLAKADGRFEDLSSQLFGDQLDWFEEQFRGCGHGDESRALAVHLLSCVQGASAVCQALGDPEVLCNELGRIRDWLVGVN